MPFSLAKHLFAASQCAKGFLAHHNALADERVTLIKIAVP
jgi:hypothetical protein